jgi:hypothetical protein
MDTKDRLGLGPSTERDGEMADIEQVAGWLYRHEMPNASRVVRGEVDSRNARIAELTAEVASYKADAEYMQWIADNGEVVTTGQGMRLVLVLNVFGNNNWSLRDYLSMEINGTMDGIARNALREGK